MLNAEEVRVAMDGRSVQCNSKPGSSVKLRPPLFVLWLSFLFCSQTSSRKLTGDYVTKKRPHVVADKNDGVFFFFCIL